MSTSGVAPLGHALVAPSTTLPSDVCAESPLVLASVGSLGVDPSTSAGVVPASKGEHDAAAAIANAATLAMTRASEVFERAGLHVIGVFHRTTIAAETTVRFCRNPAFPYKRLTMTTTTTARITNAMTVATRMPVVAVRFFSSPWLAGGTYPPGVEGAG